MGAGPAYIYRNVDVTVNYDVNHDEFEAQFDVIHEAQTVEVQLK
jgi:hypothetical protein